MGGKSLEEGGFYLPEVARNGLNRDAGMPPGIPNSVFSQFGPERLQAGPRFGAKGPQAQDPEPPARSSQLALALAFAKSGGSGEGSQ
jgi:hypothetical protein